MKLDISENKIEMGRRAANLAAENICEAIAQRGEARVIFATGASQFEFIEALLTHKEIDWSKVCGFHLDEYVGLSADHPASFRKFLKERYKTLDALNAAWETQYGDWDSVLPFISFWNSGVTFSCFLVYSIYDFWNQRS